MFAFLSSCLVPDTLLGTELKNSFRKDPAQAQGIIQTHWGTQAVMKGRGPLWYRRMIFFFFQWVRVSKLIGGGVGQQRFFLQS